MSYAIHQAPREHFGWVCSRVGHSPSVIFSALEAVDAGGRIVGMVGFDHWTPGSVQMCVAIESPHVLRNIRAAFDHAFVEKGRRVAIAFVSAANTTALKLYAHLGFRESHRISDGLDDGVDLVLVEMRREECRWLSKPRQEAPNA